MGNTAKKIVEENPGLAPNVVELFEKVVAKADEDSKKAELPINPATGNKLIVDDSVVQAELALTMAAEVAAAAATVLTGAVPVTEATDLALDAAASPAPIPAPPVTDDIRAPLTMVTTPKEPPAPRKPWFKPMMARIGKTFSEGWTASKNALGIGFGRLVVGTLALLFAALHIIPIIIYGVAWFIRACVNWAVAGYNQQNMLTDSSLIPPPAITDPITK